MKLISCAIVVAAIQMASAVQAQPDQRATPQAVVVAPLPAGAAVRPVALTRLRSTLRNDQQVGQILYGVICIQSLPAYWRTVAPQFTNLGDIFGQELKAAGFKPDREPGSLFDDRTGSTTDLQVGALVKGVDANYCENLLSISGKIRLDVEWQVYSSIRREVVATIETHEGAQKKKGVAETKDKGPSLAQMAFAANVRALLADTTFRQIVTSPDPAVPSAQAAAESQAEIRLLGAAKAPTALADATGSVVTIFAGEGFGSGVLVSTDGLILTNHHVVGEAKTVRVRWSDGLEATAEVVRSNKGRDVALIRAPSRARIALALNRIVPSPGAQVFAIGTPLDPKLQSTVTRGIVSANRIVDGFSFIQGDVPVTHGNSGGPLLDEKGRVVGLTDWGIPAAAGSTLNFFIPIGDAMDFLGLKSDG